MDLNYRLRLKNDDQFVFDLFLEHKAEELIANTWPNEIKLRLIGMQFTAFEKSIASEYVNLEDKIVVIGSIPIGRMILNRGLSEINLLYISILRKYQGKGYGKKILNSLIEQSDNQKKTLTLNVSTENPAFKLYQNIGFRVTKEDATKYTMTYPN